MTVDNVHLECKIRGSVLPTRDTFEQRLSGSQSGVNRKVAAFARLVLLHKLDARFMTCSLIRS